MTALSGVRISCDSVARNSSFRRDASSAICRAWSDAAICLRNSRSEITRSVTSSISVIVPITACRRGAARFAPTAPSPSTRRLKVSCDRQQVLVKALRENPDGAGKRVRYERIQPAVHEIRKQLEQRSPDHFRGRRSGLRRQPAVPAPDDQAIVGDEYATVVELFEPLGRARCSARRCAVPASHDQL